jgi:gamma-polyglutamate biosynthesis protein CapC
MLPIFSPNGMQHSLTIPIFIGVVFMTLMMERYGWVFSGLVVLGYLSAVFVTYPLSGVTIVIEACLTYAFVRTVSDSGWLRLTHTPLFGRDRFLAIVVVGILVRLLIEELVVPAVIRTWMAGDLQVLAASRGFGSVGLVIVPLLANLMWKQGMLFGLRQSALGTIVVMLAVKLVLEPFTNFNLSRYDFLFEDVALDFAASAKAQIIILCGCFLASRTNLAEGWDYSGILIPPLIALSMFEPIRLIVTFVEALVILIVGKQASYLPWIRRVTLSGPRLTTYLFAVAVFVKIVVGWIFWFVAPAWTIFDFYGFGFLLSTLIAGKLWTKGFRSTLWPSVFITACTFLVGVGVAFGVSAAGRILAAPAAPALGVPRGALAVPLEAAVLRAAPPVVVAADETSLLQPRADFLRVLARAVDLLQRGHAAAAVAGTVAAETEGTAVSGRILAGDPPYLLLGPRDGVTVPLETVLLRLGPGSRAILVASPSEGRVPGMLGAAALARAMRPGAVVLPAWCDAPDGAAPRAHSAVRWLIAMFPRWAVVDVEGTLAETASLDFFGAVPAELLPLADLRESGVEVRAPGRREGARSSWFVSRVDGGYSLLRLGPRASLVLARVALSGPLPPPVLDPLDMRLQGEFDRARENALRGLSGVPDRTLEHQVTLKEALVPLILAKQRASRERLPEPRDLADATVLATAFGLRLDLLVEQRGDRAFLVLRDGRDGPAVEGTVVFTLGSWTEKQVEVPSPYRFPNTSRAGLRVFFESRARVYSLGGAGLSETGIAGAEGASVLHNRSLFHVVHQSLVEEAIDAGRAAPLCLQVRGRIAREGEVFDGLIVPMGLLSADDRAARDAAAPWIGVAGALGWRVEIQSPEVPDRHDVDEVLQARYRRAIGSDGLSGLWVNSTLRYGLGAGMLDAATVAGLGDLGFEVATGGFLAWWEGGRYRPMTMPPSGSGPVVEKLLDFLRSGNVAELAAARRRAGTEGWVARVLQDPSADATVVVLIRGDEALAIHLGASRRGPPRSGEVSSPEVFLRQREPLLYGRRSP